MLTGLGIAALCVVGASLVGGGICIAVSAHETDEEKRTRINNDISSYQSALDVLEECRTSFSTIKVKLVKAKNEVNLANKDFTDGGHLTNGTPLGYSYYINTYKNLENSILNINNILGNLTADIQDLRYKLDQSRRELASIPRGSGTGGKF